MKTIKLFEAFAGIGSQFLSLKEVVSKEDCKVKLVGQFEWYIDAIIAYESMHHDLNNNIDNETSINDMRNYLKNISLSSNSKTLVSVNYWNRLNEKKLRIIYSAVKLSSILSNNFFNIKCNKKNIVEEVPEIDILTYSFPCQDLSVQGLQKGMNFKKNTRSSLLWEIDNLLNEYFVKDKNKMPKVLLLENVANILSAKHKKELSKWLQKLEKYGYKNDYGILNARDFGSAQNRKRFFCISSIDKKIGIPKIIPITYISFEKYIEDKVPKKYKIPKLKNYVNKDMEFKLNEKSNVSSLHLNNYSSFNSENILYDPKFTFPTLTASGANSRIKFYYNNEFRMIQPIEAWRLMGISDEYFWKVKKLDILNDGKLIYLAGNAISIEVLNFIFKNISQFII